MSVCDFGCVLGFPFLYWHRRPASPTITTIQKMICRDIHFLLSPFIHSILPRTHLTSEPCQLLYVGNRGDDNLRLHRADRAEARW